jgi:hypothetical protein
MKAMESVMLSLINPAALPALRIAATFFLTVNILAFVYIFRNRHRFFDKDPNVSGDIPAVRRLRVEVILIPWCFLTTGLLILLIALWCE